MNYIILLLIPIFLYSKMLNIGDQIGLIEISDQKGKIHKLKESQTLVVTWDRYTTSIANNYFDKNRDIFKSNNLIMIVDVSQTPSGIMNLFVLPKMRSYDHDILLSDDEAFNLTLPYSDHRVTIIHIEKRKVKDIKFVDDEIKLGEYLRKTVNRGIN